MDIDDISLKAEERMGKAVEHTLHEFSSLHTGKASPGMVEGVLVEVTAYGSSMHLRELAAVTTPDPRTIQIQPWDKSTMKDIERAIQKANLGLNPRIDGAVMRVAVPELTGERRRDLAKVASGMAEDGRISVRQARREAIDAAKALQKDGKISEDDLKLFEKDIQAATDEHIKQVNEHLAAKEKDITTV